METAIGTKICSRCRRDLPLSDFNSHPDTRDRRQYSCRKCISEYNRRYYAKLRSRQPRQPPKKDAPAQKPTTPLRPEDGSKRELAARLAVATRILDDLCRGGETCVPKAVMAGVKFVKRERLEGRYD